MVAQLKNNIVWQLLLSASQVLLPLVTWPYITRVLGPENLGKVNYIDFLCQVFMIVASFGIPFYATREISFVRGDTRKRGLLIKELIVLQGIFAFIAAGLFAIVTYKSWAAQPMLCLFGLCNILIGSFTYEWYVQGMEHFKFAAIRTIFARMLMLVCFFILVKASSDYDIYYAIFTFGMIVIAFINAVKMIKENSFEASNIHLKKHLTPLWHFFLTSSAITIYVYFDTILLQFITKDELQVGLYTTALKMVKIFLTVIIALSTVLLPRMSYLANENKREQISTFLTKYFDLVLTAGLPVCVGLFILSPEIIDVIAGGMFSEAVPLMRALSFLPLIIACSNMFCFQVLVPFKQEKKFLTAVIAGCAVSLSLNFILIPVYAAQGAAYASTATELVVTVLTGVMAFKIIPWKMNKKLVVQTMATTILFIPLVLACRSVFSSSIVILCASIGSATLLYFFIQYYVFKNAVLLEAKLYVQQLLKR
jgi:O-antigen/teichoic acid export membrane protein